MAESRAAEWTCDEVLQLITEYGKRPALWDPDCIDYKNRFRKHQKWVELAEIFKRSKPEVERKVQVLNSQYRRERLKAARMRELGKLHRITWYGYSAYSFMNKHLVRYKNRNNLMNDRNVIKQEVDGHDSSFVASETELIPFLDNDDIDKKVDGCAMDEDQAEDNHHANDPIPFGDEDETLEDVDKEDASSQQLPKDGIFKVLYDSKDEWTLFGELVAHSLRKLPDLPRCIAKQKINTILYEAELAELESASSDKADK